MLSGICMLINHHIWSYLSDFWLTPEAVMNYAEDLFQGYRHHHNRFSTTWKQADEKENKIY